MIILSSTRFPSRLTRAIFSIFLFLFFPLPISENPSGIPKGGIARTFPDTYFPLDDRQEIYRDPRRVAGHFKDSAGTHRSFIQRQKGIFDPTVRNMIVKLTVNIADI